jgi:(E)-4-hydroxy-3-methylbut-2-enyl-diphosphate synthase
MARQEDGGREKNMNKTTTSKIGGLKIGSKYPVRIKGMLKTPLNRVDDLIAEAKAQEAQGVEAIRVAIKEESAAKIHTVLKKHIKVPMVADIHFHYKSALAAIDNGFEGIRLNPLNIAKESEVREIVRAAKKNKVSIRVGINSGGFKRRFSSVGQQATVMVKAAGDYIKMLEKSNFFDIMVSLKGADVVTTIAANRLFAKKFSYPVHLGVTATGLYEQALVKSAIGIGVLLNEGIGNVIRVSLSAPSVMEIKAAKNILTALDLRRFGPEIISCPTCSRCEVDLINVVKDFEKALLATDFKKPVKIAVMGCVVNGPGEAYQADIGAAFGKDKAAIFKKDKILGFSTRRNIIGDLLKKVKEL